MALGSVVALPAVTEAARVPVVPGGAADIRIDEAWIVDAPKTPDAYLTLTNTSDKPVEIRSVDGACCGGVWLVRTDTPHRSIPVKGILVRPHTTLAFRGNHVHFLLQNLKAPLAGQNNVQLTLHFDDHSTLPVTFELRHP